MQATSHGNGGIFLNRIPIHCKINGEHLELMVDPNQRALDVLRDQLRLTGTKEGCGVGECGACTILCGGLAVNSCLMPAVQMDREDIWTAEGLAQLEIGQQLQRAFSENGAVQCGFCTPGMLMSAYALLLKNPKPDEEEIRIALSGNLCRCTEYDPIIKAIQCVSTWRENEGTTLSEQG